MPSPNQLPPIPEQIETERLLLRIPRAGDGERINAAIHESFEQLHRWMDWARRMPTLLESETYAREAAARFRARDEITMLIIRRSDGLLAGGTSLHTIDWSVPRFEIGYWLRTCAEGHGYATEAVSALAKLCFEALAAERVEIRCDIQNERSAAVAERAGFTLEARLRRHRRNLHGALTDTLVYARLREDGWR